MFCNYQLLVAAQMILKLGILLGLIYGIYAPCGKSPVSLLSTYIVGGQEARSGDFPWQVGLVESGYLICGGTMVTGKDGTVKVITAAHCVTKAARFYSVAFGMHNTRDSTENRVIIPVSSLTVHPSYNSNSMTSDIAILHFGSLTEHDPSLANTHSHPACLPTRTYTHLETSIVSGWGTTSEGGSTSSILRYVTKPVLSWTYCNTQTDNKGYLDSTMMCAGETNKDACQGDSGGPLVAYRNNVWELIGVVSWGFGCGRANYPGVYSDPWALRTWISNNL